MKISNFFYINKEEINFVQTLMCGQIFSYKQFPDKFIVLSGNKKAEVFECETRYKIVTDDIKYFQNFFDLKTDYEKIKQKLLSLNEGISTNGGGMSDDDKIINDTVFLNCDAISCNQSAKNINLLGKEISKSVDLQCDDILKKPSILPNGDALKPSILPKGGALKPSILPNGDILKKAIGFGSGIRILKQDLLEVIISFVFSANNNIKRITSSLFKLREKFGTKCDGFSAFPTLKQLAQIEEKDFKQMGAGYRSAQLVKLIKQLQQVDLKKLEKLETQILRKKLIELSGIGPKVADCILLFGFSRTDVFPVDTWIRQVFNIYYEKNKNTNQIRKFLTEKFGNLSGYAQQYLFYYQRSFVGQKKS